jgi:hypothetical protein
MRLAKLRVMTGAATAASSAASAVQAAKAATKPKVSATT